MGTTGISYQLGQRKFLHGGVVKPLILLINIFSQSVWVSAKAGSPEQRARMKDTLQFVKR